MKISCYLRTLIFLVHLVCLVFVQLAHSAVWDFPSTLVAEVLVSGSGAYVQVTQVPANTPVKITIGGPNDAAWLSAMDGNKLRIQNSNHSVLNLNLPNTDLSNTNLSNMSLSSSGQETNVQIQLPVGKKLTVVLSEGRLSLGSQIGGVFVHILKGQITAQRTVENLQIYMQKGEINVEDHQGDLNIETYGAKVVVKNILGNLEISNFMGETWVEKPMSRVHIQSRFGSAKINAPKAGINFDWGIGQLKLTELAGRCEGHLEDGNLIVSTLADSELEVHALRGKIQVSLPNLSGAWLNLRTSSTELLVPSPLKPSKDAKYLVVKGRLSGVNKGSVVVHGEETSVIVR